MRHAIRIHARALLCAPVFLLAACNGKVDAPTVSGGGTSLPSAVTVSAPGGSNVAVTTSSGGFSRSESMSAPTGAPAAYTYPLGFFGLDITGPSPGFTTTLTFTLPAGQTPSAFVKCLTPTTCAVFSGATVTGNVVQVVLKDGGAGDTDGVANGVIHDPGAPAFSVQTAKPACSDGVDNDGDGKIDYPADPGCTSAQDDDEHDVPVQTHCPLAAGAQTLVEWDGTVAPDLGGIAGSKDSKTFAIPAGCTVQSMTVGIVWQPLLPVNVEDLDLSLDVPTGATAPEPAQTTNTFGDPTETITMPNPIAGSYTANATAFLSTNTKYHGKVTLVVQGPPACSDGVDNDGDGKTDFPNDPGCSSAADDDETDPPPPPQCADGIDNDHDGKIDSADPGCSSASDNDESDAAPSQVVPRVVVADIDTGINPYHIFYNPCTMINGAEVCSPIYPKNAPPSSVTPEVLAAFGIDAAHQIQLTRTGNFAADFAADKAIWDHIKSSNPDVDSTVTKPELYWFKGTNIIAASFDTVAGHRKILPDPDVTEDEHGVGTSAAVLAANPDAIILFAESGAGSIGNDHAETLGFLDPLVDIVTTSYGSAVPVVGVGLPLPFVSNSFDSVLTLGKLHFSSAANSPDPFTPESGGAGPWWSVGIAGIEEGSSNGKTALSGFFPDFVSDFTQNLPYCADCETDYNALTAGTSFATPRSAGVASRVLLLARRQMHHAGGIVTVGGKPVMASSTTQSISNFQLRRALEQAAYVDPIDSYDPVQAIFDLGGLPPVTPAPFLTVAWGNLSADPAKGVVNEALARLGFGTPTRSPATGTCEFQTALINARHFYWDNVGTFFNTYTPPADDPFIYCGSQLPSP